MMDKGLTILLFLLIFTSLVSAAPTKFTTNGNEGCEIAPIFRESLKVNTAFDFNFHTFNKTNSYPITNATISCVFHLYNQTGDHSISIALHNDPIGEHQVINEWDARIEGKNFSSVGTYAYIVQCNGTSSYGGCADKGGFLVTNNGFIASTSDTTSTLTSIIVLIAVALFFLVVGLKMENTAFKIVLIGLSIIVLFVTVLYNTLILEQTLSFMPDIVEGFATFLTISKILMGVFVVGLILAVLVFSYNLWQVKRGFK